MANDLMKKVGELLDLAGLDKEVIKSVTEKLIDEKVQFTSEDETEEDKNGGDEVKAEKSEGAKEEEAPEAEEAETNESVEETETVEESACPIKKEEEDDEDTEKAPVDPAINKGGICVESEEKTVEESKEETVEESEEVNALEVLLGLVKEAFEKSNALMEDFEALKEEHAKLLASLIVSEADTKEEAVEESTCCQGAKEDEAEVEAAKKEEHEEKGDEDAEKGDYKEAKKEDKEADKDAKKEEEDYEKAHESSDEETAEKIAESVTEVSEEAIVEETKPAKKTFKAWSAFSPVNEAEEVKEEVKVTRKAFTLFPDLK